MDKNSLAHTSWNCEYHIVFAAKYQKRIIYGETKTEIGKILRMLREKKDIRVLKNTEIGKIIQKELHCCKQDNHSGRLSKDYEISVASAEPMAIVFYTHFA